MALQRAEVRCSIETTLPLRVLMMAGVLQRAEVRCSIETVIHSDSGAPFHIRCSARKCAALLRHPPPLPGGLSGARCSARKCAALLRRRYWATARRIALALQRAEVRCSIETP